MAKQSQQNAGRPAGDNKIPESSFGSYLATNLEQEVAALNRARTANPTSTKVASKKINGLMVGAAVVIVASVAGIIALSTWAFNARQPAKPPNSFERPPSISIPPTIQRPNRSGIAVPKTKKPRVRRTNPPSSRKSIYPRRTSATVD